MIKVFFKVLGTLILVFLTEDISLLFGVKLHLFILIFRTTRKFTSFRRAIPFSFFSVGTSLEVDGLSTIITFS